MTTPEPGRQVRSELQELLRTQIANYEAAVNLEEKQAAAIEAGDTTALRRTTREKNKLMGRIEETDRSITPLMTATRPAGKAFDDAALESLRQRAVELLQTILTMQAANTQSLVSRRQEMMAGMSAARAARQVARGYKPSHVLHRPSFDTKS